MKVYLDSSVVVRWLRRESAALPGWGGWERVYSSVLLRVETLRTIDRIRLSRRNTEPLLDALKDNGGPTLTIALLPGSPAINAGGDARAPRLDQRNYLRVGVSDIGAYEFGGGSLRITSITRVGEGPVMLEALGIPNADHTLEFAPDLSTGTFAFLKTVTADATGLLEDEDADAVGKAKRFYRIRFISP